MCDDTFSLVHCDIWGPYQHSTHTGHRFFATSVDDKSRYTWIYLLKHKSNIKSVIPWFWAYFNTQFNNSIKFFRTDNAMELAFEDFFVEKGIIHHKACVAKPQ